MGVKGGPLSALQGPTWVAGDFSYGWEVSAPDARTIDYTAESGDRPPDSLEGGEWMPGCTPAEPCATCHVLNPCAFLIFSLCLCKCCARFSCR